MSDVINPICDQAQRGSFDTPSHVRVSPRPPAVSVTAECFKLFSGNVSVQKLFFIVDEVGGHPSQQRFSV